MLKEIDEAGLKQLLDRLEFNVEGMLEVLEHYFDPEPEQRQRKNSSRKRIAK